MCFDRQDSDLQLLFSDVALNAGQLDIKIAVQSYHQSVVSPASELYISRKGKERWPLPSGIATVDAMTSGGFQCGVYEVSGPKGGLVVGYER